MLLILSCSVEMILLTLYYLQNTNIRYWSTAQMNLKGFFSAAASQQLMLINQFLSINDNNHSLLWLTGHIHRVLYFQTVCFRIVWFQCGQEDVVLFLTLFVYDHFALKATEIYVQFRATLPKKFSKKCQNLLKISQIIQSRWFLNDFLMTFSIMFLWCFIFTFF